MVFSANEFPRLADYTDGMMRRIFPIEFNAVFKRTDPDYDPRIVVLGHLQRGGAPTCFDTVLSSRLGAAAAEALITGRSGLMVGRVHGRIVESPLETAWTKKKHLDSDMLRLVDTLSI